MFVCIFRHLSFVACVVEASLACTNKRICVLPSLAVLSKKKTCAQQSVQCVTMGEQSQND